MKKIIPANFNLIFLGTDTLIETPEANMPGYERREILNAVFNLLDGEEFIQKHIVSGATTTGVDVHRKVIEGVWMALKAISEGKTTIKVAAHSRGGIQAILFAHVLEKTLALLRSETVNANNILEKLDDLHFNFADDPYLDDEFNGRLGRHVILNGQSLSFKTEQTKCDKNPETGVKDCVTPQQIDIEALLRHAKDNIKCEALLIDPVPGPDFMQNKMNWAAQAFFEIPKIVQKIDLYYMQDERTTLFEPVLPHTFHQEGANIRIHVLRGHHGTASGKLTEQYVNKHFPTTAIQDENKENKRQGKETRHAQYSMAGALTEFFGKEAFRPARDNEDKRIADEVVPPITKVIYAFLKADDMQKEKLKHYNKMQARENAYNKFQNSQYGASIARRSTRSVLIEPGKYHEFNAHPDLVPLLPFVNEEHIYLAIKYWAPLESDGLLLDFLSDFKKIFAQENKNNVLVNVHQDKLNKLYNHPRVIERYSEYLSAIMVKYFSAMAEEENSDKLQKIVQQARSLFETIEKFEATHQPRFRLAYKLKPLAPLLKDHAEKSAQSEKLKLAIESQRKSMIEREGREKRQRHALQAARMKKTVLLPLNQTMKHGLIEDLNIEICRLERMEASNKETHRIFINSLRNLSTSLNKDIEEQRIEGKSNIKESNAAKIAIYALELVQGFQKNGANRLALLQAFESKSQALPGWERFFQALRVVCFAGVGFVLGAFFGASVGLTFGTSAFVFSAISAVYGACFFGAAGVLSFSIFKTKPRTVKERALLLASETQKNIMAAMEPPTTISHKPITPSRR